MNGYATRDGDYPPSADVWNLPRNWRHEKLPVSPCCTHAKAHGGAKSAVRQVQAKLAANRFVLRTDVKSYYAFIDHVLLMERLARFVHDWKMLNLCGEYEAHRRAGRVVSGP